MPHDEYYLQKFGKRGPELKQHIKEAGRQDGVQFAGWDWRGNTMAGHRYAKPCTAARLSYVVHIGLY